MEAKTHEFHELLQMISELKERVSVLEGKAEAGSLRSRPGSIEQVELFCSKCGLTRDDAKWIWAKMECSGWRNDGKVVRSWTALITSWRLASYFPSQKRNGHQASVFEMKTALEAKQREMKELADRYYNDSGPFHEWNNEPARQRFILLKREAKELNARIGNAV